MLREAVVHALLAHLGTRQAVKALEALEGRTGHTQKGPNAAKGVIETYGEYLSESFEAMWDALMIRLARPP